MTDVLGPLDSGPNWGVMTDRDVLERARDLPVGYGEMFRSTVAESFITSPGIGTAIRSAAIPETVPERMDAPLEDSMLRDPLGAPRSEVDVPPRFTPPQGARLVESEEEYQIRRQRAGALSKEEWEASPYFRTGIPYDAGMTQDRASALAAWYDTSKVRQDTIARGPGGVIGNAVWVGGMFVGGSADPINYIPIFGPEVRAAQIAKFGRLGGSALTSAADAMLSTVGSSAATAGIRANFGDEVTWQGFLTDVAISTVIGGAFGAATSRWKGWQTARSAHELERVVEARRALNDALHDVVQDRPVEVTPAVADAVARAEIDLDPRETTALFRKGGEVQRKPMTLTQFIARGGGIPLDDEALARDFGKVRVPGAGPLARANGRSIDGYWREALIEAGYFPPDADGYMSRDITKELFDALEAERLGKKRYSANDVEAVKSVERKAGKIEKAVEEQASLIAAAHEELGIRRQDMDAAALYDAANRLVRGEETDPVWAYERALISAEQKSTAANAKAPTDNLEMLDDGWEVIPPSRMAVATPQPDAPDPAAIAASAKVGSPAKSASDEFGIALKTTKIAEPAPEPPAKKTVKAIRGEDGRISGLEVEGPSQAADLAKQQGISIKTGDFPEMAEFEQLVALGRVTPDELAAVKQATELEIQSDAYAKALEAAAICRVGM